MFKLGVVLPAFTDYLSLGLRSCSARALVLHVNGLRADSRQLF
jgi:hypothetical protein